MFSFSLPRSLGAFSLLSMSTDHLNESDIAGFLDGDCTASEHSRIERHLEECAACRRAVVDVGRIAAAYDPGHPASSRSSPRTRRAVDKTRLIWAVAGTALAASLTLVVLNRPDQGDATLRSAVRSSEPSAFVSRPTLVVASPADDTEVTGDSVYFRWNSRGRSGYRMTILDETGASVFTRDTPDTLVVIATAPMLASGHRYFWRVDAISDGVIATSAIRTFRVAR
jgi:hypothetical protein